MFTNPKLAIVLIKKGNVSVKERLNTYVLPRTNVNEGLVSKLITYALVPLLVTRYSIDSVVFCATLNV